MAADILLYNTDAVPVGDDQRQHLELTRDIAGRFQQPLRADIHPSSLSCEVGARIMSLMEPTRRCQVRPQRKRLYPADRPAQRHPAQDKTRIDRQRQRSAARRGQEGIANLMNIYAVATGKTFEEIQAQFEGKGYGVFKSAVAEAVIELLRPVRQRTQELLEEKDELLRVCKDGAERAGRMASRTLEKVHRKIGFIRRV